MKHNINVNSIMTGHTEGKYKTDSKHCLDKELKQ